MRVRIFSSNELWRQIFKRFNGFMLLLWRLRLGKWINAWPRTTGRIMVIAHSGRTTGKRYETPVNYAPVNGEVYCVAAFGDRADWYRNLKANPKVEVRLPKRRMPGVAMDVSDCRDRLALIRKVLAASGFASYLAGIHPAKISDEDLAAETSEYRLIRIVLQLEVSIPG